MTGTKNPVGFISEMSAEPIHGGGVTMHRILGEQIDQFDWFAKTLHFPGHQPTPEYPSNRHHYFSWWQHESWLRKLIGSSRAHRLSTHPRVRRSFARHVAGKLRELEPEILDTQLLVCPQADVTLLVMEQLQKQKQLSYVTWIMDDHLVRWQHDDWRYPAGFEQRMANHLQNAESVFVISSAMQDFYRDRFQVESTILCGPATPVDEFVDRPVGKSLRLAYFGSLGRWQNDAIELLVPQLSNGRVSLDVYSHNPNAIPTELSNAGARLCAGVPATEVPQLCRTYDAIVLPISFADELKNMSYFNIATKFSECLGSGVPTLMIGPPDAIMVKIASRESAAVVVDRCDRESMNDAIDQLFDTKERIRVTRRALELVQREFSYDVMRSRWNTNAGALLRTVQQV